MCSALKTRRPPTAPADVAGPAGGSKDVEDPQRDLANVLAKVGQDAMAQDVIDCKGNEGEEAGAPPGRKQAAGQRQPGRPAACRANMRGEDLAMGDPKADDQAAATTGGDDCARDGAAQEEREETGGDAYASDGAVEEEHEETGCIPT